MAGDDDRAVVPAPSTNVYTGPREQSDLAHDEVDAHNLLSGDVGAITVSDIPDELQERWGHAALPGFRNYIAAATAALDWSTDAEELNDAFNALPGEIQYAIADQLAISEPSKTQLKPADPQYVHEFMQEDFGSFVVEVWGERKTPYLLARVDKRIDHIMARLSEQDQTALLDWFDTLHAQDCASIYLALSGVK